MTARALTILVGSLALAWPLACGGQATEDAAGGTQSAGGQPGAGGLGSGGESLGGAGGTDAASGGGGGGGGVDGSGGAGSAAGCPPAPIERLLPRIGPFWFGPDPGPCSGAPEDETFSYADGLLASSNLGGGETYLRDDRDRLVEVVSEAYPISYEYVGNQILETSEDQEVVYTLSLDGYPLVADVYQGGQSGPVSYTYTYADCRLVLRDAPGAEADRTYGYDVDGHLITVSEGGSVTTYDYGCW